MNECRIIPGRARNRYVGDPIDVVTGANAFTNLDFEFPGPVPLRWRRYYDSSKNTCLGALGWGHTHEWDHRLVLDLDGCNYIRPIGETIGFPHLDSKGNQWSRGGIRLRRVTDRHFQLRMPDAPLMIFEMRDGHSRGHLVELRERESSVRLEYSEAGFLSRILDPLGRLFRVITDESGRVRSLMSVTQSGSPLRTFLQCEYDANGNLVEEIDMYGNRFRFRYDKRNRMITKTDRRGFSFHFEYDEAGRCIYSAGDDGLHLAKLEYHPEGKVTLVDRGDGGQWFYQYDNNGSVVKIINPLGGITQFVYDEEGNLVEEIDPNGKAVRRRYSESGQLIESVDGAGRRWGTDENPDDPTEYRLPTNPYAWEFGQLVHPSWNTLPSEDDPLFNEFPPSVYNTFLDYSLEYEVENGTSDESQPETTRDELGRVSSQRRREYSESWKYDPNGNVIEHRDRDGSIRSYDYHSWNLPNCVHDSMGNRTTFDHSTRELLTRLADPGGAIHEFEYDVADRLERIRYQGRVLEQYRYDSGKNIIEKLDEDGNRLLYWQYGEGNLVSARFLSDGEEHTFAYDDRGRLVEASTPAGTVITEFDSANQRLSDIRDGVGIEHTFDNYQLTRTTYLGKFVVRYRLEDTGTLRIEDPRGVAHRLRIGSSGLVLKKFANGSKELSHFDSEGRCRRKAVHGTDEYASPWLRGYGYSAAGDLIEIADSREGLTQFAHDSNHRLAIKLPPSRVPQRFVHDASGNVLEAPGLENVIMSPGNFLLEANGSNFTYDNRGNLIRRAGDRTIEYVYDSLDRLIQCTIDGQPWSAEYDAYCRRVSKTWNGVTTRYYWDDFRLMTEARDDGPIRLYIYPDEHALVPMFFVDYPSLESNSKLGRCFALFTNQIGVPVLAQDDNGKTVWHGVVSPYGKLVVDSSSSIELNLRFPGHYFDSELNLHYNRFRYYSPELARYTQLDPFGIAGGINLTAYVARPLTNVDIDGLGKRRGKQCQNTEGDSKKKSKNERRQNNTDDSKPKQADSPTPAFQLPLRGGQANEAAAQLGFRRTNFRSRGQPVYTNGRTFITPDVDGHNGGAWKQATSVQNLGRKNTRMGTYDIDLNKIGD